MLKKIIIKEIQANIFSKKFHITFAVCFSLIMLSYFLMQDDFKTRMLVANKGREINRNSEMRVVKPFKKPEPLSVFAQGLDPSTSIAPGVHGAALEFSSQEPLARNVLFELFPPPDFVYIVSVIMSILAIFLGFNLVTHEKEKGTLRLYLSNSIPRYRIILGKIIGAFLSIILPVSFSFLLVISFLFVRPEFSVNTILLLRIFFIYVFSIIYIFFFVVVATFISTCVHKSSTSLYISLFIWIVIFFLLPGEALNAGKLLRKIPSIEQHRSLKSSLMVNLKNELTERINKTGNVQENLDWFFQKLLHSFKDIDEQFMNDISNQANLMASLSRVSPVACFIFGVYNIAGTGIIDQINYKRAFLSYEYGMALARDVNPQPPRYKSERDLMQIFETSWIDLIILILFSIVFTALSLFNFNRYDVR